LELIELKSTIRAKRGNGPARRLRVDKRTPAVLYGQKQESVALSVDTLELEKAIKNSQGSQVMLNLVIENGESISRMVLLKELQTHPVSRAYIHADFMEISMDRKIRVMVPVVTVGKCRGVEMGGMLQIIHREVEVLTYPDRIPESIKIDVTELDMGKSVHIEDVPKDGDIDYPHDVNFAILTVASGRKKEKGEGEGEGEAESEDGAES